MEIVSAVVGKLTEYAIDPLLDQFKYIFCYNSKIQTLEDKVKDLKNTEFNVRRLVDEAERNVEDIKPNVKDWLQKVDDLKKQADEVFDGARNSEMQCLFLRCPNLKSRYSFGRKATKKTVKVAKLEKEGTFPEVGDPKPLVQTPYQNPDDFGAFEARISIKKDIMEALKDKNVRIIGICGMGGVGKTTMAKEVAKEAEVNKLFHEFAWADVSQVPAETKIQDALGEKLGLKIKDITDKYVRVQRLHQRLAGDRTKSILVTLDDVWDDTVLETIGIPSAGDGIGLKIILTSRNKDVCERLRARIFDVHHLNEEDSWELFKEKAEISDDATDVVKDIAVKIAKECEGLPLALVTVGRALFKKPEDVWKNALEELLNSRVVNINGVQKLVYSKIELSYNCLESNEAKSLLLLCSFIQQDSIIHIEYLVRCAWGLGLFEHTKALIKTRLKVNSIVDHLKSCYLLLSTWNEEWVKLHDVVRYVCLQIASKEQHVHKWKKIDLKERQKHDNNELYSAISLTSNELNRLPSGLEYPNLEFLAMNCNQQSLNISEGFFANMKGLKVLDFTDSRIQIPLSIQSLTNLRTLCLEQCTLNTEISTIGTLKNLEVLSFYDSNIDHFPNDIAELSNLRSLDLRLKHSSSHCPLPPGILSHLKRLEELYMGVIGIREDEQRGYIINEISSLTGLNTFQISTNDPQFLLQMLKGVCIEKLERFHIELTDLEYARDHIVEYYFRRRLHIRGITYASVLSQPAINSLMRRSDRLSIEMELNNLDELSLEVMKRENMLNEDGFEYLNGNHPTGAFDRLQDIYLCGIPKMKHLFRGVIKPPSIHNLTVLKIGRCPSLKSLFSESVASRMVNLKSLFIFQCEMLEEIVSVDTEQNEVIQMLEFPKLRHIELEYLDNLKSFRCGSNKTVGVLSPLFKQVTFPNLELLDIDRLGCTVKILDELRQIRSHKLRDLTVENLDDVCILFDFEYTKDDAEINILSQLTSLTVRSLPKFVHFTRMFPRGICIFENLTHLLVEECDNLRYLFSPSMANSLVALTDLWVWKCEGIEEIIGRQEEDDTSNTEIVFPKLRNLSLYHLDRFRLLSSQNYELVFHSLDYLLIEECPMATKLCSKRLLSAPKLDKVWINDEQSIDISNFLDSEGSISM